MNLRMVVCMAFVLSVTKLSKSKETVQSLPKCGKTDAKRFPSCAKAGFHFTAVSLANEFLAKPYMYNFNYITAKLGNCSSYTSYILCSLYMPRCKEDMTAPWLPCQEVCVEFVRGCSDKMDLHGLNWLKPLCGLLRSKTKNSGKSDDCFEPPNFKPSQNDSQGLSCNEKVKNKRCLDAKCTDTFVSGKIQENKDFKDNENNTIVKLNAIVKSVECRDILTKLACASYTPPCEKEGNKMKTLCRSRCVYLFDSCPEVFNITLNITEVAAYCAVPAEGDTDSGFCELERWPSARHWDGGSKTSSIPYSFSAGLVAVLVLVPLLAIIFIYIAVAVRRHFVQKKSGYVQQRSTYTEPDAKNPTANEC